MWARTLSALALLSLIAGCGPTETARAPEPVAIGPEVAVTGGTVHGTLGEDGLKQYHGIPYAAAPVGDRRWAPPGPVEPWADIRTPRPPARRACSRRARVARSMDAPTSRWTRTA